MFQRSADVALGVPFNIASYSFLTHLLAKHCDLEAHEFIYYLGNAHIYESHLDTIEEQLTRTPYKFPTVAVNIKRENINDYVLEDFKIINESAKKIRDKAFASLDEKSRIYVLSRVRSFVPLKQTENTLSDKPKTGIGL